MPVPLTRIAGDRRQFGRRWSHAHGWICIEGRPRVPCIIKNFSEGGALLELDNPAAVLNRFRLEIDTIGFSIDCQVRHHAARSVGVSFMAEGRSEEPQPVYTIDELMARAVATDSPMSEPALDAAGKVRRRVAG